MELTLNQMRKGSCTEITIQGLHIQISFAAAQNTEAPRLIREILKRGYLMRQSI